MIGCILSAAGTAVCIAVGVLAAGLVIFAAVYHAVQKKRGKNGCGCGCAGCSGNCPSCRPADRGEEKKNGRAGTE